MSTIFDIVKEAKEMFPSDETARINHIKNGLKKIRNEKKYAKQQPQFKSKKQKKVLDIP